MSRGWPATLPGDGFTLRPLRRRDGRAWSEARRRNTQWLGPWDATAPPGTDIRPATFGELSRTLRAMARDGSALPFVIEVEGALAGQLTVSNIVRGSAQFASLGYWIDQQYAGRGIVPRAVALAIDHCFGPVGLHRVEISVRPENSNSLRVVEKLGLHEVGLAPGYLHIDGAWRDHRVFAVTREEVPRGLSWRLAHSSHE